MCSQVTTILPAKTKKKQTSLDSAIQTFLFHERYQSQQKQNIAKKMKAKLLQTIRKTWFSNARECGRGLFHAYCKEAKALRTRERERERKREAICSKCERERMSEKGEESQSIIYIF